MSLLDKLPGREDDSDQPHHQGATDSNLDMVSAILDHLEYNKEVARCIIYI